jgi:hypothetical protein
MKKITLGSKLVKGGIIAVLVLLLFVGFITVVKASNGLEAAAKENRLIQADFVCLNCGYACNADVNAAINIRMTP